MHFSNFPKNFYSLARFKLCECNSSKCFQFLFPAFKKFYKIFDATLVIRRTNILKIRLLFPHLGNDSLEYILFFCLHYIKRTDNYQFSFKINGGMGCDFLILKRVAKKINFSIFQLLLRKLQHYISHIIEIISKITSINLSIQEKNKIN